MKLDIMHICRRAVLAILGSAGATVALAPGTRAGTALSITGKQGKRGKALIQTAEAAGIVVLEQANMALAERSFAVGGAIIENSTGLVVHQWRNTVY